MGFALYTRGLRFTHVAVRGQCTVSFARLVQRLERLALRVDPDVRVVLQHPARQMTADRLQHVIGDAEFGELRDDRVTVMPMSA